MKRRVLSDAGNSLGQPVRERLSFCDQFFPALWMKFTLNVRGNPTNLSPSWKSEWAVVEIWVLWEAHTETGLDAQRFVGGHTCGVKEPWQESAGNAFKSRCRSHICERRGGRKERREAGKGLRLECISEIYLARAARVLEPNLSTREGSSMTCRNGAGPVPLDA